MSTSTSDNEEWTIEVIELTTRETIKVTKDRYLEFWNIDTLIRSISVYPILRTVTLHVVDKKSTEQYKKHASSSIPKESEPSES
jgi:hypothetical protein